MIRDRFLNFFLVAFNMQASIACVLALVTCLKTIIVRYSGITLSLNSLCSLAKATFSITTEVIVTGMNFQSKKANSLLYLPLLFLEQALNIMLEISADA